jgi:glucose-6-phosphate isomerase
VCSSDLALTAVGLLPAWIAGVDIDGLLRGAAMMAERCTKPALAENPASVLAAVACLHHRLRQRPLHVMMPYADALRPFAAWYVQLWAESLGKRVNRRGQTVETGPTPLAAIGATDQHAQVQLFMEGPRDKLITFVRVKAAGRDVVVPRADGDFAYLSGVSMNALLDAEREGTTQALAQDGRPSLTLTLDALDAEHVGGLVFLYEAATAIAGELYAIDAFDQPGVEEGKRLAFGLLGREGYTAAGDAVRTAVSQRPQHYRV